MVWRVEENAVPEGRFLGPEVGTGPAPPELDGRSQRTW